MSELTKVTSAKDIFANVNVQKRFEEMLGNKAQSFITNVLQIVNQNSLLKKADPKTVMTAAATAASLDLSINPNLGQAYIIPYNIRQKVGNQWETVSVAQFQMGYKGFIQLAQRSGQYKSIVALPVYENQFKSWDPLYEDFKADLATNGTGKIVGYVAAFELLNGFRKVDYWTREKASFHGQKYSKSFNSKKGLWQDQNGGFDSMAVKTVLKNILSKYGPMKIDSPLITAITLDQSIQRKEGQPQYPDNPKSIDENGNTVIVVNIPEIQAEIEGAKSIEEIDQIYNDNAGIISRDINLMQIIGKAKSKFIDNE